MEFMEGCMVRSGGDEYVRQGSFWIFSSLLDYLSRLPTNNNDVFFLFFFF